jgi:hypothetical protein
MKPVGFMQPIFVPAAFWLFKSINHTNNFIRRKKNRRLADLLWH